MSLDKSLSLVPAQKPRILDRKHIRRDRLTTRVRAQITILEKMQASEPISREQRRLPKWWWSDNGAYFVSLFYTRKPLELAKGKWAVQCADISAVIEALKMLSKAVSEGHFDAAIEGMARKVRQNFGKAA